MTTRSVTILFYYTHGYDRCPLSSTNKIKHTTTRDNFCSKNCRKRPAAQYTGLGEKIADRSMTRKILRMGFSRYIYLGINVLCNSVHHCTSVHNTSLLPVPERLNSDIIFKISYLGQQFSFEYGLKSGPKII